jgi:hypothetical protein
MAKSNFKKVKKSDSRSLKKANLSDKKELSEYVDCLLELHKLQGVLLNNLSKRI